MIQISHIKQTRKFPHQCQQGRESHSSPGYIKTSDTRLTGPSCLYPSPSFLSTNQLAKEDPDRVAPVVIPALTLTLDKSLKSGPQAEQRTDLCVLKERFNKDISHVTLSSWIKKML